MPHAQPMRLIARIRSVDAGTIACDATDHTASAYPLRLSGALHPSAMIELGAQAAAAHASLHGGHGDHIGLLLAMQAVQLGDAAPDEVAAPLEVTALRLDGGPEAARYTFRVGRGDTEIVSGSLLLQIRPAP